MAADLVLKLFSRQIIKEDAFKFRFVSSPLHVAGYIEQLQALRTMMPKDAGWC
jgi:hypothetical protein